MLDFLVAGISSEEKLILPSTFRNLILFDNRKREAIYCNDYLIYWRKSRWNNSFYSYKILCISRTTAPFDTYWNCTVIRLNTHLNESPYQNSIKFPKVVKPTNKKTLLKNLGTSVINSPLPPFFLFFYTYIYFQLLSSI